MRRGGLRRGRAGEESCRRVVMSSFIRMRASSELFDCWRESCAYWEMRGFEAGTSSVKSAGEHGRSTRALIECVCTCGGRLSHLRGV
jgi:hypothetical protein